tara:strand:+ start:621 stop:902 length:282 start_codon:yes stop_codon:yes gene_type:complete
VIIAVFDIILFSLLIRIIKEMYYLLTGIIAVSILRYFNLVPKMTSKFWTYIDYILALAAFVLLLSRIPPFFSGVLLTVVAAYAWRKGYFDKFR